MLGSNYSRQLEIPTHRAPGEWGVWLKRFLEEAANALPESALPLFLRHVFRWLFQSEGTERLSEEEMRYRKERFYYLLPPSLQVYFPWEPPVSLPEVSHNPPSYPQAYTPFRQYGFWAARWAELLGTLSPAGQVAAGSRLVRFLLQSARNQGHVVEEETLLQHLYLLSGEKLSLSPQGIEVETREPPFHFERRHIRSRRSLPRRR
ncbi:MAG: hypothetical protein RMJ66_01650 [Bacteroidia bacterium]|nr:hypothetical protein [Bacteroidia bacterium]MDW8133750.1 hypothetical protein [Bacteroidia bacterium]